MKMQVLLIILAFNLLSLGRCRDLKRATGETDFADESERNVVCIDDILGCFPETRPNEETSFGTSVGNFFENKYFRSSRKTVATEFRFWAPGKTEADTITNANLHYKITESSGYDPNLKAFFIIHGYHGGNAPWAVTMKDALMQKEPSNIFIVDWSGGDGLLYGTAAANTWIVGAELGRLIERIGIKTGMTLDKVHIIGHSLGSHAAGFAGKWLKYKLGKKVRRITGLDAAGPDFEKVNAEERLDRGDAEFVDTIHTNQAYKTVDGFGIVKAIGHFDFYPNGGDLQPGCVTSGEAAGNIVEEAIEIISPMYKLYTVMQDDKKDIGDAFEDLTCNHGRAIQFFTESINSAACHFSADNCDSWKKYESGQCEEDHLKVPMGYDSEQHKEYTDPNDSKKFYLRTNSKTPFCRE